MESKSEHFRTIAFQMYLHLLIIAIIGIIAYSNTFHVPFVLDDVKQVEKNLMLRDLSNFLLALKGQAFDQSPYEYFPSRSVGFFSFALNYHFGGLNVTGYHVVNLVIHLLNAFLVYLFVVLTFKTPYFRGQQSAISYQPSGDSRSVDSSPFTIHHSPFTSFIALFSALLFVAHPIQTQAVTYIAQRFASLATLFYLLSIVMYIKGRLARRQVGRLASLGLSLVTAVLAIRTKEIAYTLPFVIILYESVFFTAPLKKKLLFFLPIVLILISVLVSVIHSDRPLGEMLSDINERTRLKTVMARSDYLMTEMRVVITYIRLIFLPINQNLDYDYPIYRSFLNPQVFLSFLLLSALLATAIYLLYRSRQGATVRSKKLVVSSEGGEGSHQPSAVSSQQSGDCSRFTIHDSRVVDYSPFTIHLSRLVAFGILWFFITLSVESSFIPIVDVIFEHRLYLPSVGLLTAITTGLFAVAVRFKKVMGLSLILVLTTLGFSFATHARNALWKDDATLWEDVVKKSPNKARPHNYLGEIYSRQGRLDEAIREYQAVLRLNSDYDFAHNNLGTVYAQQGRLDEAVKEFQEVLRLKPGNAHAHNNLGVVYEQQGRLDEAIREYQAALRLDPDHADAHYNLGAVFERQGRLDEAIREYQAALKLNPDYADARNKLEVLNRKVESKKL